MLKVNKKIAKNLRKKYKSTVNKAGRTTSNLKSLMSKEMKGFDKRRQLRFLNVFIRITTLAILSVTLLLFLKSSDANN
ncbi:MAG: hypothetical protein LBI55_01060 [Oscillospiraceae bacterium]|jgi:hypothetical protein|nr:hypothetical protein [Oscillospiraceae bacterium]